MERIANIILLGGTFVSETVMFFLTIFSVLPCAFILILYEGIMIAFVIAFCLMGGLYNLPPEVLKVFFGGLILAVNELAWVYLLGIASFFLAAVIHWIILAITGIVTFLVAHYGGE